MDFVDDSNKIKKALGRQKTAVDPTRSPHKRPFHQLRLFFSSLLPPKPLLSTLDFASPRILLSAMSPPNFLAPGVSFSFERAIGLWPVREAHVHLPSFDQISAPLVTPFKKNGDVDVEALKAQVVRVAKTGMGLVSSASLLSDDSRKGCSTQYTSVLFLPPTHLTEHPNPRTCRLY